MVDCLHVDDVADILTEKGLDKRPSLGIFLDTALSAPARNDAPTAEDREGEIGS